jgi:GNAT superfamily N-acetyltransferase
MQRQTGSNFKIRSLNLVDGDKVSEFMTEHWGSDLAVVHDTIYKPATLPGFIAFGDDEWLGLITYHIEGDQCEIVTLDSLCPSSGIGTALLQAVKQAASEAKCQRLWLITTNDNLNALRFYQKRGFVLVAVHRKAVEKARKLKPEIPAIGAEGIPLRDEIELEMALGDEAGNEGFA